MILVTGGTGLVGSQLIKTLLAEGKKVKSLHRKEVPFLDKDLNWIEGDILDVITLEEAMQDVEQVYHCAAVVSFHRTDVQEMFKINIEGTANVVNACLNKNVKKLCFVSSVAALGRLQDGQEVDEQIVWTEKTSNSNYGKSKYLAEMEVWRGIGEGLNAVIINPVIILGEGDWSKGSSGLFKSAFKEFPWYTDGVTGFVDVRDVVKAMIELMNTEVSAERFIISEGNYSYKQIFSMMATNFNKKPPHKKATRFMSQVVWRIEAIKAMISGSKPLLTKETAATAQAIVHFNNQKLFKFLPFFTYTPIEETIKRVCKELDPYPTNNQ
jgi:nucleoside-diphosphate-sugar epimerase